MEIGKLLLLLHWVQTQPGSSKEAAIAPIPNGDLSLAWDTKEQDENMTEKVIPIIQLGIDVMWIVFLLIFTSSENSN